MLEIRCLLGRGRRRCCCCREKKGPCTLLLVAKRVLEKATKYVFVDACCVRSERLCFPFFIIRVVFLFCWIKKGFKLNACPRVTRRSLMTQSSHACHLHLNESLTRIQGRRCTCEYFSLTTARDLSFVAASEPRDDGSWLQLRLRDVRLPSFRQHMTVDAFAGSRCLL